MRVPVLDPGFLSRFEAEEALERIPNYRIASGLAAIFIAAGSVMDRLAFPDPELWHLLVLLRAECAFTLLMIYVLLGTQWGARNHLLIGHLIEGSTILSILAMIGLTGGRDSPYYAGLCLVMVGASLFLRWSLKHGMVNVLFCCGGYSLLIWLLPESAGGRGADSGSFVVHTFFLYVTGFFTAAGTCFLYELRKNEFRLREELNAERRRLEESHSQLRALDETKTNFFANVSHELRTPLTLILGPLDELASFPPVQKNSELNGLVRSMEENGLRLLRLVNELLDLIRLDGREEDIRNESVEIESVMNAIYSSLYPVARRKSLSLTQCCELDSGAKYFCDRVKVEKILMNLAMNAVKFTSPGGMVSLVIRERDGGGIELVVADSGEGMTLEEQQNVFRRFWQADASAKRMHQGAGIGLSLVKSLVDQLEGDIEVKSELGKGSTFVVRLPNVKAVGALALDFEEVEDEREEDEIAGLNRRAQLTGSGHYWEGVIEEEVMVNKPKRQSFEKIPVILLAEDEPDVRQLIVSQLRDYEVLVARDGEAAFQMAQEHQPDLILLDWMMPKKDGLEVCRLVRKESELDRVPVVMLTARVDERSKILALEAGANDFLTKPFVPTELKLRIRNMLDTGEYEREVVRKSEELGEALKELKESESMLVQAEKLSSLGQMSAGIIHEINNPLNYAKTNLYSMRTFSKLLPEEEQEDFAEVVGDVEEGLERVVQIVQDLRSFAVKDKAQYNDVNLGEILATTRRLLGNRFSDVEYECSIPDHIHVDGNSNQLTQVFINFIQNALDAIKDAGRESGEGLISISCEESEEWVSLHFRDNGCGISKESQEKIFDPFYTSKEIGHGMGLGLSICYRILEQHGVRIEISSEIGIGTHFTLNFPVLIDDDEFNEALATASTNNAQLH